MKRIVVALGGNAILTDDPTSEAQQKAVIETAKQLKPLFDDPNLQVIITHGNGPQVGNLLLQELHGSDEKNPAMPMDVLGGMTQGEIGYWLVNAINQIAPNKDVATIVSRTEVDGNDPAFKNPTKPIGPFYSEDEKDKNQKENPSWTFVEDSGRGFRRVVPSPKPISIVEDKVIASAVDTGAVIIAAGGGGIPVIKDGNTYQGVEAVIDKDFTAAKLAEIVDADELIILTAVDNVYINFGKDNEEKLETVTNKDLQQYLDEGQFGVGSMKPKVQAVMSFIENGGEKAVITSLKNVGDYLQNGSGTILVNK